MVAAASHATLPSEPPQHARPHARPHTRPGPHRAILLQVQPPAATPSAEQTGDKIQNLLDAAEPVADAHALVIGPNALETLCGLIGRGCAAAAEMALGGRLAAERTEIVLAPQVDTLTEAAAVIAVARRALLPCGRIVLHAPDGHLAPAVTRLLRAGGFSAVRVRSSAHGTTITADWPMFGLGSATSQDRHHA